MAKKFTEEHEVLFYECDTTGKLTIPMMLNIVIKTSEKQSEGLGRGSDYVSTYGLTWVITQYEIELHRVPRVGEKVKVTTQATNYNKYFCYRNFWIHDEEGKECVTIKATFVLMDLINRKMSSVPQEIIEPYECEKIKKIERAPKVLPVEVEQFKEYRVRFSDIDSNQHVNNSRYLDWMTDVLGYEFLTNHVVKTINIKFDKEVEYGNNIQSYWDVETEETENGILTKHQVKVDGKICAEANITWTN